MKGENKNSINAWSDFEHWGGKSWFPSKSEQEKAAEDAVDGSNRSSKHSNDCECDDCK